MFHVEQTMVCGGGGALDLSTIILNTTITTNYTTIIGRISGNVNPTLSTCYKQVINNLLTIPANVPRGTNEKSHPPAQLAALRAAPVENAQHDVNIALNYHIIAAAARPTSRTPSAALRAAEGRG